MPTVYITAPPEAADEIARTLVEERLAACVNRFPGQSVYRWEGEVFDEEEVVLLAKTSATRYEALRDRVLDVHPYDVPCLERFDEADTLQEFATWRAETTKPEP